MTQDRKLWLDALTKISGPVLRAAAAGTLARDLPLKYQPGVTDRAEYTYLETLGRTLVGIAPWLETKAEDPDEEAARAEYAALARASIAAGVTPGSPDLMNFSRGFQPIVDAAFLAEAILRAPTELWEKLDGAARRCLVDRMKETRTRKPYASNWLLFGAMIEAFLRFAGEADWDPMRIDYALKQHMQWYRGDGLYGDGPDVHVDYYNSFVIQPMLCDVLLAVEGEYKDWDALWPAVFSRAAHFASLLEQLVAPDGSFPVLSRSSCYRFGAFQSLAQAALLGNLEKWLTPGQARSALSAVIARVMAFPGMFDADGWLNIGVCGEQPNMGEGYISTGSLYLCTAVFLPLGLPESAPFWQEAAADWTQKKIWSAANTSSHHALTGIPRETFRRPE